MKKAGDLKSWKRALSPKYKYISELGTGSYGCVCLATNKQGEEVAIKKFSNIYQDQEKWRRIMREVEIIKKLNNANVVAPIEVFMYDDDLYLVLEYGEADLCKVIKSSLFLDEYQIKTIMYRILCGIEYMHSRLIMHRDLKTANILINSDCSIRICDFSLSRSMQGLNSTQFDFSVFLRKNSTLNFTMDSFMTLNTASFEIIQKNALSMTIKEDATCFQIPEEEEEEEEEENLLDPIILSKSDRSSSNGSCPEIGDEEEKLALECNTREHIALDKNETEFVFDNRKKGLFAQNIQTKASSQTQHKLESLDEVLLGKEESKSGLGSVAETGETEYKPRKHSKAEQKEKIIKKTLNRIILQNANKEDKNDKELTGHISTRWYRPPEIILIEKIYTAATDVWSLGCIFGELLNMLQGNQPDPAQRRALFPGKSCFPLSPDVSPYNKIKDLPTSERDQLNLILKKLGTPTKNDLEFLTDGEAIDYIAKFPKYARISFKETYPATEENGIKLLEKMLQFNPYKRITVKEALRHPYFKEVRQRELEVVGEPLPLMIDADHKMKIKDITTYIINH